MVNYHPNSIAFLITDKCTADCKICGIEKNVSPHDLPLGTIYNCIDQAHELGIQKVGISGGEPFIRYEDTKRTVRYASSKGMTCDIVTNGSYATDKETGFRIAEELKKAGLENICISFDEDHLEHVPYESCFNAIEGALSNSIRVTLYTANRTSTEAKNKLLLDKLARDLGGNFDEEKIRLEYWEDILINEGSIKRSGRARELDEKEFNLMPINGIRDCSSEYIVVKSNGDIVPCCSFHSISNNFYVMGNLQDTKLETAINRTNESIIGSVLFAPFGPKRLINIIGNSRNPQISELATEKYASLCEFCSKVFSNPLSKELVIGEFNKFKGLKPKSVVFEKDGMPSEDKAKVIIESCGKGNEVRFMNYLGPLEVKDYYNAFHEHDLKNLEMMERKMGINLSTSKKAVREVLEHLNN